MSKIIISEAEKNEILKMYINEVKIDDSLKTELINILKTKNKEFISELITDYNNEVPATMRTMVGSLDNLENNLLAYFNSKIPSFLSMIEMQKLADASTAINLMNGVIQIFEKEIDDKFSGVGGWGKKQLLKTALKDGKIKDKQTLIAELTKPGNEKQFSKYVREILGLIEKWSFLSDWCKTSSLQVCKKYFTQDFSNQYSRDYFNFFKRLWVEISKNINSVMLPKIATKIASKVFD
jgi:hypothetical protein